MNNIYEVSLTDYKEKLKSCIENLSSVNECFMYNGQLEVDDINSIKIDLNKNLTTCFINVRAGNFIHKSPHLVNLQVFFNIFILGRNDFNAGSKSSRSDNEICIKTMHEIASNLHNNKFGLDVIGYPIFGNFTQISVAERNKVRFSIYDFEYSQEINFLKNK